MQHSLIDIDPESLLRSSALVAEMSIEVWHSVDNLVPHSPIPSCLSLGTWDWHPFPFPQTSPLQPQLDVPAPLGQLPPAFLRELAAYGAGKDFSSSLEQAN